jgi:hypothetical protein
MRERERERERKREREKTWFHYVDQDGLELEIFLSQSLKWWDYRCIHNSKFYLLIIIPLLF